MRQDWFGCVTVVLVSLCFSLPKVGSGDGIRGGDDCDVAGIQPASADCNADTGFTCSQKRDACVGCGFLAGNPPLKYHCTKGAKACGGGGCEKNQNHAATTTPNPPCVQQVCGGG